MKTLKYLFIAALAAFTFNACEDVPAPYTIPTLNGSSEDGSESTEGVLINESFKNGFGVFTPIQTEGEYPWIIDYSTAKATAYVDNQNYRAQSWLIASPIDLTNETEAYISFNYIIRYAETGKVAANHQLLISNDYVGDPTKANWINMDYGAVEGTDWTTFYNANVAIPKEFIGKSNITIALKYTAADKAGTWEVKNFKVTNKTVGEEDGDVMTVAQALAAYTGTAKSAVVKGYIVGYIPDKSISEAVFASSATSQTNIIIADSPNETDINKCLPIQLPPGEIRNKVNLQSNPGNYKKAVTLTGSLEAYFGKAGLKTVTKALFEGEEDNDKEEPTGKVYINETFANDLGSFTAAQMVNEYAWKHEVYNNKGYAKVSGFANNASQDAESWLISPAMDFSNETAATISFEYVINKGDANLAAVNHKLMITSSYSGDFYQTNWEEIPFGATNDGTWTFRKSGDIAIPEEFMGKEAVVIAFKYTSTTSASSTWEVMNVVVTGGEGSGDNTGGDNGENDNPTAEPGTIAAAIAAGPGNASVSGTIVATYERGFLVSDNTGSILVYLGEDKGYAKGDVVTVSGATTTYAGLLQFGNTATVEVTGTTSVPAVTAKSMSASDLTAYLSNPTIQYVTYKGTLEISGYYYNIIIDGTTAVQGSLSYPKSGIVDESLNGKEVIVTGYTIGVSKSMYVNTMATSVVAAEGGSTTTPDDDIVEDDKDEEEDKDEDVIVPAGSISVAQAIAAYVNGQKIEKTVTGYIIGYAQTGNGSFVGVFKADGKVASNIIIADNPNEEDSSKCLPVALPSNSDIRKALNLIDNPENLGKRVTITGSLEKYFSAPGLKTPTAYSFE